MFLSYYVYNGTNRRLEVFIIIINAVTFRRDPFPRLKKFKISLTKYSKTRVSDFSVCMISCKVTMFACRKSRSNETAIEKISYVLLNNIPITKIFQNVAGLNILIFALFSKERIKEAGLSVLNRLEFDKRKWAFILSLSSYYILR